MDKNKIEPLVSNDNSMKNTSRDFKQMKIEEMKLRMKSQAGLLQEIAPSFLLEMKASLSNKLVKDFHYDPDLVDYLMNLKGLPANDINLVFQLIDEVKKKLKSKNRSLTPISIVDKKESEEADLKNKFFIKNPYVKHRFFRSRNGKNYNFYEKIKKKSENLDETKRVLDMQNKRIYETSLYDKKPIHKGKNNSIEESPQNSPNKSNIMKNEFESAIKVAQKNEIEIKESQSEIKLNPKKKKIKARIFRHTKKENINNYDDLFYDPGKGSLDCNLCIMCQQTKIEILSLPCGHSCSCQDCFLKSDGLCLFCNSKVKNYVLIEILKKKTIEKFDEDEEN